MVARQFVWSSQSGIISAKMQCFFFLFIHRWVKVSPVSFLLLVCRLKMLWLDWNRDVSMDEEDVLLTSNFPLN